MCLTAPMYHSILVLVILLRPESLANKGIVEIVLAQELYLIQVNVFGIITFGKSCLRIFIVLIMLHGSDSYIFHILKNKVRIAVDGS